MRILRYNVRGKTIIQDPSCDFSGLFPGKYKKMKISFSFSDDWDKTAKVVEFLSMMGTEYTPQVIDSDGECMIPTEALLAPAFKIKVLGRFNGDIAETKSITIYQKGGSV